MHEIFTLLKMLNVYEIAQAIKIGSIRKAADEVQIIHCNYCKPRANVYRRVNK